MENERGSGSVGAHGVFISYRRGETTGQARALHSQLSARYDAQNVFMDVDSIAPGEDFANKIQDAISSCAVLLAFIGRDWLVSAAGVGMLDNPDDFVRLELVTALEHCVPVIPILVEHTPMPTESDLPESLRSLTRISALTLENTHWDYDVAKLVSTVEPLLAPGPPPVVVAKPAKPVPRRRRRSVWGSAAGLLILLTVLVVFVVLRSESSSSTHHPRLSASKSALSASPDTLAEELLYGSPTTTEYGSRFDFVSSSVDNYQTSGLVTQMELDFAGANDQDITYYLVFQNRLAALKNFRITLRFPGYIETNSSSIKSIADLNKCIDQHNAGTSQTRCSVLSGNVIVYGVASTDNGLGGHKAESALLAEGGVRYLRSVASHARRPLQLARIAPEQLAQLLYTKSYTTDVLPDFLSDPVRHIYPPSTPAPAGEVREINVDFTGADQLDQASYFVFNSNRNAQSWWDRNLAPVDSSTHPEKLPTSGFSQPIYCKEYEVATEYESVCFVLQSNVVIESIATNSTPLSTTDTDNRVTEALVRTALLDLFHIDGSRPQ
jgi:hypothetical protein